MSYYNAPQRRDDNIPGYLYLVKAIGYHGLIPGCLLGRYKIGLTRDLNRRLDEFHSTQPPCDYEIVASVFVENMLDEEQRLHKIFRTSNVKLKKSREYFDLLPWQVARAKWEFSRLKNKDVRLVIPKNILLVAATAGIAMFFISHQVRSTIENPSQSVAECVRGGGGKACEK